MKKILSQLAAMAALTSGIGEPEYLHDIVSAPNSRNARRKSLYSRQNKRRKAIRNNPSLLRSKKYKKHNK